MAGTVANRIAGEPRTNRIAIEHPSGFIDIELTLDASGELTSAGVIRTARRIFDGAIHVPTRIYTGA
jgi:2-methylaconitate cis-trans-isomerase PrpF